MLRPSPLRENATSSKPGRLRIARSIQRPIGILHEGLHQDRAEAEAGEQRAISNTVGGVLADQLEHHDLLSGLVRLHVLHHAAQHPVYGQWMIDELTRHGYRLSPGTL